MATIERRGTSYRVSWRLGGKRDGAPQSCTFKTPAGHKSDGAKKLAEAAKALAESRRHDITRPEMYRAILGEKRTVKAGEPTLAAWADQWLADRGRFRDIQADSLATYAQHLRDRVIPQLGHLYLSEINEDTVHDWVAWLQKQKTIARKGFPQRPLSPQTIQHVHSTLRQLLAAAVPRWLPVNPVAKPAGARKHTSGLPKVVPHQGMFLEPHEVDTLLVAATPAIRDLIFVAVRTGLRLGELLVLRVEDVALTGRRPRIMVRRGLKRDRSIGLPKSEKSSRDVTISKEVVEVLAKRTAGKKRHDLLFPAPEGGVWNPASLHRYHWAPTVGDARRCGEHPPPLPPKPARGPRRKWRPDEVSTCSCPGVLTRSPRFHDLRHTHVSLLVEDGWTPKRVQLRVGHASFQITMDIYGHLWEHGDEGRLDSVERLLAMSADEEA